MKNQRAPRNVHACRPRRVSPRSMRTRQKGFGIDRRCQRSHETPLVEPIKPRSAQSFFGVVCVGGGEGHFTFIFAHFGFDEAEILDSSRSIVYLTAPDRAL